ncbi:MAG: hypothetical protein QF449_14975 [Alphaproteobacteria bacterium]|nr:hypothetical protein [Alphaproteobacteria bacterium]MDP6819325.1 hypothetical protein [Alphaproteobacteria bacterium]
MSDIENLTGSGLADTLTGDSAANLLSGGGGNDTLDGGAGNDVMTGGAGDDTFMFAAGSGDDNIDGGAGGGWTDSIDLGNPGVYGDDWTIELDSGSTIENQSANSLDLSEDASGTINLSDGSEIIFDNMERVDW